MENSLILNNSNALAEKIIKILAFFDLFERPLTVLEIRDNLDKQVSLIEIKEAISNQPEIISCQNGFYFLKGREETVKTRQQRHNYSVRKIKIARRFVRLFKLLPFIKVIALANSIGQLNLRDGSDIDLFIITAPHRLWLSRLYCAGLAKLFNRRPTAKNKKDKLCLSFYISQEHLNLNDLRLPSGDPYFEYWQRGLVLLYNRKRAYEMFLAANCPRQSAHPMMASIPKTSGDFWEKIARRWQLTIMAPELKREMNKNNGVVVSDSVLKLYLTDRRQEFLDKYEIKIRQIFQSGR